MCSTIMNLLSLANEDSVPGADDFVPVLVFVLIKVSSSAKIKLQLILLISKHTLGRKIIHLGSWEHAKLKNKQTKKLIQHV